MSAFQGATFAADVTKQLLTLATGVLAVTVTFMSDLVPNPSAATTALMAFGWFALLVCVMAGTWCLLALTAEVGEAERETGAASRASIFRPQVMWPARVQALAFLAGLILILLAATLSLV